MISVNKALSILKSNLFPSEQFEMKLLNQSDGYALFEDIFSTINMPPFAQSAMDGYAINLHNSKMYNIIDEVKAGDHHQPKLEKMFTWVNLYLLEKLWK